MSNSYGRREIREFGERLTARAKRAIVTPLPFKSCAVKTVDPNTGLITVTDYSGNTPQDLGPMLYYRPWAGDEYGDEVGLEPGMHVAVLCVDREGNDYVAFDAAFDQDHKSLGAQPGERYIVHKSGSFVKWMADQSLRLFAAGVAYLYGTTKVWLGDVQGIDDTEDAVITKRYLDQWYTQQQAQTQNRPDDMGH